MFKLDIFWDRVLGSELNKPYMKSLIQFLRDEKNKNKIFYPEPQNIFQAFSLTPFETVRVVILGQDPYHGPNQAHGLCFSVAPGVSIPPSLRNIYKELQADCGIPPAHHGDLRAWAQQGVLLLNSVLTVEANQPAAHQGMGWEIFTDKVIQVLNEQKTGLVFVLWGAYAQKKGAMIDASRHLVLSVAHPSPFSAYRGFFGSRPFSTINAYLEKNHQKPINWQLPE